MNKMLIAIFDTEATAHEGLVALRQLHNEGDITLYATGVVAKDLAGTVSVPSSMEHSPSGAGLGLAVGGLIGLLGGPLGLLIGASTGAVAGTLRDMWVVGVGMDFIEEAERHMAPGKVALVAELDEEWITPVDAALAPLGAVVLRRARSEVLEARFDQDIAALKAEIQALEAEAEHASESAQAGLQAKLMAAQASLDAALQRAQQQVESLKAEADAKAQALKDQLNDARSGMHDRIDARLKRVKSGYHARGHKLSQAWSLTKEALSV